MEKKSSYISRILQISIFFFSFCLLIFFIFFDKCLFVLWVLQSLCCTLSSHFVFLVVRFVGSETPKHNPFDQFRKIKFHFVHFPRNMRFLSFDRPSNNLYLRTTNRHFREQENVRHPISKLLKCDLVQTLSTFLEPFIANFCCREGISCFLF